MTNMATMPIYGKNLKKSSTPEAIARWPWNLICSIVYASTTKVVQIMTLGWPWPILRLGQIWLHRLLYGESENYSFFELIAALGLKVAWSIQLNELMKLSEYQRSRSFFDLGQRSLRFQSQMFDFWSVYSGERFRASWLSCFRILKSFFVTTFTFLTDFFRGLIPQKCIGCMHPVLITSTVLGWSFWYFAGAFRMIWKYTCAFFRIMNFYFCHLFTFLI